MYAAAARRVAARAATSTTRDRPIRIARAFSSPPNALRRISIAVMSGITAAPSAATAGGGAGRSSRGGRGNKGGRGGRGHQPQGARHFSSNGGGRGRGGRGAAGGGEQSGRGRGGGAGRSCQDHDNQHKRSDRRKASTTPRPVQQFTSDFRSMHSQCQAARYKVHAPGCGCSKMKVIRERVAPGQQPFGQLRHDVGAAPTLDGLAVLPDIKSIPSVYLCLDTNYHAFMSNAKDAERKLHDELFSANGSADDGEQQPYKVSCAQCLLKDNPNGFVCVSSPSIQTVEVARDLAIKRIRYKKAEQIPFHSDHSEHVCVVSRKVLWQYETAKTRDQSNKADYSLRDILSGQGVENLDDAANRCEIDLGHHLASLLHITKKDVDADSAYWLVMLQWTGTKYKVDLPGGKRHLGETSWEGATRECEEECSLQIDSSSWVHGEPRRSARKADQGNVYYMLRPPVEMMMGNLESNPFWSAKGFCKEPVGVE